ncbi:MAG: GspE/PulE family protein [Ignavibacteriales bacterium]
MPAQFNAKAYNTRRRLGEILVEAGCVTEEQIQKALEIQKETGDKLGEILVKEGYVNEEQILKVIESQFGIQYVDITKVYIDAEAVKMIPEELCRKHVVAAIEVANGEITLAMKDPLNYYAIEDIKLIVALPIKPVISSEAAIYSTIEKYFGKQNAEKAVQEFEKEFVSGDTKAETAESIKEIDNAPIVKYVNSIIENSIRNNASDIHIEPEDDCIRVRIRVDGILNEIMKSPLNMLNAIITRIKVMADMNVAEKRVPQDGRIAFKIENRNIDLRVSTIPTIYGEKTVMRVLDKTNFLLSKSNLGLSEHNLAIFDRLVEKPYGIILVTGPTGSGKTSTLYTILSEVNDIKKNIITLEDPVEYNLKGINQIQLNSKAGLTFAAGLRSILRQDPDIVMVGEIRDSETAEISIRAALTGHLVLSTLHTNDAPGVISRLTDMGIEPFLVSSSLIGIIAQRLVRKICPHCKKEHIPDDRDLALLGIELNDERKIYKGAGCRLCGHSGYKGRTAIFEIMEITKDLRLLIDQRTPTENLRDQAVTEGMVTLRESCKHMILEGVTTIEEMIRITYA